MYSKTPLITNAVGSGISASVKITGLGIKINNAVKLYCGGTVKSHF